MRPSDRYYLSSLLAELTRAINAAHRYEDLRYRGARHGITPEQAPRRVFDTFYAVDEAVGPRPAVAASDASKRPYRTAKASP
ncbi:MAG TPA: hypothetical protein VFV80_12275 [Geminicoccaceae bacterium]|nr:hypothetical protein [Geminicoccaceae bacterium]